MFMVSADFKISSVFEEELSRGFWTCLKIFLRVSLAQKHEYTKGQGQTATQKT